MILVWLSLPITALRQPDLPRGPFFAWWHIRPLPSSLLSREEPHAGDLNQLDLHFTEEPQGDSVLHGSAGAGPLRWTEVPPHVHRARRPRLTPHAGLERIQIGARTVIDFKREKRVASAMLTFLLDTRCLVAAADRPTNFHYNEAAAQLIEAGRAGRVRTLVVTRVEYDLEIYSTDLFAGRRKWLSERPFIQTRAWGLRVGCFTTRVGRYGRVGFPKSYLG